MVVRAVTIVDASAIAAAIPSRGGLARSRLLGPAGKLDGQERLRRENGCLLWHLWPPSVTDDHGLS